jgi:CHAT domain-containing protein
MLTRSVHKEKPRGDGVLALGDPIFAVGDEKKEKPLPPRGLLITQVVPGGNAASKGLKRDDVLIAYARTNLTSVEQLAQLIEANANAKSVEVKVWREEQTEINTKDLAPGELGVVLDQRPAREAIADRRKIDAILASRGKDLQDLPGTRIEVTTLKRLFGDKAMVLTDSDASEQKLEGLRMSGELSKFRYLHFATHGQANNVKAFESVLYLSRDKLPKDLLPKVGEPFINGELSARKVMDYWKLDAELVTLSACETGLGRHGGGEGLLGFAQAFLHAGSRAVCLSLWKVDDAATALLMDRFYRNLLGKRDDFTKPMGKADALAEAKNWLRNVSSEEALKLTAAITNGVSRGERGKGETFKLSVPKEPKTTTPAKDDKPFAHPRYWAAFILIGDPN